jgi:hypothetical protein
MKMDQDTELPDFKDPQYWCKEKQEAIHFWKTQGAKVLLHYQLFGKKIAEWNTVFGSPGYRVGGLDRFHHMKLGDRFYQKDGKSRTVLTNWNGRTVYMTQPSVILYYADHVASTFYSTLGVFKSAEPLGDLIGLSLGLDFDLQGEPNQQNTDRALEVVKKVVNHLGDVGEDAYIQYSGSGFQLALHHHYFGFLEPDAIVEYSKAWDRYVREELSPKFSNNACLVDPKADNNPRRLFKTPFTIHQRLNRVCAPLDVRDLQLDIEKVELGSFRGDFSKPFSDYYRYKGDRGAQIRAVLKEYIEKINEEQREKEKLLKTYVSPGKTLKDVQSDDKWGDFKARAKKTKPLMVLELYGEPRSHPGQGINKAYKMVPYIPARFKTDVRAYVDKFMGGELAETRKELGNTERFLGTWGIQSRVWYKGKFKKTRFLFLEWDNTALSDVEKDLRRIQRLKYVKVKPLITYSNGEGTPMNFHAFYFDDFTETQILEAMCKAKFMDPAYMDRVTGVLKRKKKGDIVLRVSHYKPDFARRTDNEKPQYLLKRGTSKPQYSRIHDFVADYMINQNG